MSSFLASYFWHRQFLIFAFFLLSIAFGQISALQCWAGEGDAVQGVICPIGFTKCARSKCETATAVPGFPAAAPRVVRNCAFEGYCAQASAACALAGGGRMAEGDCTVCEGDLCNGIQGENGPQHDEPLGNGRSTHFFPVLLPHHQQQSPPSSSYAQNNASFLPILLLLMIAALATSL